MNMRIESSSARLRLRPPTYVQYKPISDADSEEFDIFKIQVNLSTAVAHFEPSALPKLQKAFPKARRLSEWRRDMPAVFARARYEGGFKTPVEGLRIEDGKFIVNVFENGNLIASGPTRVVNVLNTLSEYAKILKEHDLYSKDLFASYFFRIEGTAKVPLGMFGKVNLSKAANYLEEASYSPSERQFLVYNMKSMDVQMWFQSNGEVRFATNVQESNIARALRLLQQSLKVERDVSIDARPKAQEDQGKSKYVFCVGCGTKLPVDATFCRSCGKEQPKL